MNFKALSKRFLSSVNKKHITNRNDKERYSLIQGLAFDEDRLEYDVRVWMNTIKKGRFDDTNKMFEKPSHCHFKITNFDYQDVIKEIRNKCQQ